jgi:hypothetical protein
LAAAIIWSRHMLKVLTVKAYMFKSHQMMWLPATMGGMLKSLILFIKHESFTNWVCNANTILHLTKMSDASTMHHLPLLLLLCSQRWWSRRGSRIALGYHFSWFSNMANASLSG